MITAIKTKKSLSLIQDFKSEYGSGYYGINIGERINSHIGYDSKRGLIELSFDDGSKVYHSVWVVKSKEKAINLLVRANRMFNSATKRNAVVLLRDMEETFKNYFSKQSEVETIYDQD